MRDPQLERQKQWNRDAAICRAYNSFPNEATQTVMAYSYLAACVMLGLYYPSEAQG